MYRYNNLDKTIVAQRVNQYRDQLARFFSGELSEEEFRPLRLQNGLYIQRHAPMLRVAIPYGLLSSEQMRMLAHIAHKYDRGYAHFTTRQNVQYNWPKLEDTADILHDLSTVNMHAIQTSGNCIRNTTSDEYAGVAADELVDPRPFCEIIRQWSTLHPEFASLPRKFKIAVSASLEDRAATCMHDIGLFLVKNDADEIGLKVLVGGGLGRTPIIGSVIREFLPWQDMMSYCEAILRVYNRYGRRDNLYKARIKILLAAECERPALLFSGGKDSLVVLHLALKAFRPNKLPFPLVHIDTGHNFPEVIEFRDYIVDKVSEKLIVGSVEESIKKGTVRLRNPDTDSRNAAQAVTLLETIDQYKFDACIGGARRDEEKARAKERIFSFRDDFGQWDPKAQRPELWSLYNTRVQKGENMRVFPISNWTEMDIWQYISREQIELPSIYFAHERQVFERNGLIVSNMPITPPLTDGERNSLTNKRVRFRTVGDMTCTSPVASVADDVNKILAETAESTVTERGATRLDDQTSEASMEKRKKEGYF